MGVRAIRDGARPLRNNHRAARVSRFPAFWSASVRSVAVWTSWVMRLSLLAGQAVGMVLACVFKCLAIGAAD